MIKRDKNYLGEFLKLLVRNDSIRCRACFYDKSSYILYLWADDIQIKLYFIQIYSVLLLK